jgi:A/G-specific adenine glycosylase
MDSFQQEIYKWYNTNKRDLPWRKTNDPYKIWISEIILQQTKVSQGINYYNRFIDKYPNIFALANSSEDNILKLWQGLGYYTRARNLHFTSKYIVNYYNGIFPRDFKTIIKLKGVGNYTAAAIASIAFNLPHAAVDGNIYRVISRFYGITTPIDSQKGKTEIQKLADNLILNTDPGFHNQAFMEFGALQCLPKSPACNLCPLQNKCFAASYNLTSQIPVKEKKVKQSTRYFYYFIFESKDSVILVKRTENDIWKNLHQFPLHESETEYSDTELINLKVTFNISKKNNLKSISETYKHVLTHQTIYARFIHFEVDEYSLNDSKFIRVNKKDIYKFAVPRLLEKYLKKMKVPES